MNNNNRGFATVIIILIVLLIAGYGFYVVEQKGGAVVASFVSCEKAGHRVTGTYPGRECLTPSGQIFTERYVANTAVNTYPTNYQQASAINAYSNVAPAYNYYPTTAYTAPAYSGPTGYVTFPIARATGYSSSYGPTTYHTSSYSDSYTPPSYYPPTYSNQYYNNYNNGNQNCYYRPDGSYTCNYQY